MFIKINKIADLGAAHLLFIGWLQNGGSLGARYFRAFVYFFVVSWKEGGRGAGGLIYEG